MRYLKMCLLMIAALGVQLSALAAEIPVKMYKNPNCGCCDAWAKDLAANGFKVETINTPNLVSIKKQYGVPESLEGCHTAIVGGYVVEGLVPANLVKRLLNEHPAIKGIALPACRPARRGCRGPVKGR